MDILFVAVIAIAGIVIANSLINVINKNKHCFFCFGSKQCTNCIFAFFVETVQIAKVTLTVSFAKEAKIVLIAKVVIFASTVCTVSAVCIALIVLAANF